jgi:hypothetical protein
MVVSAHAASDSMFTFTFRDIPVDALVHASLTEAAFAQRKRPFLRAVFGQSPKQVARIGFEPMTCGWRYEEDARPRSAGVGIARRGAFWSRSKANCPPHPRAWLRREASRNHLRKHPITRSTGGSGDVSGKSVLRFYSLNAVMFGGLQWIFVRRSPLQPTFAAPCRSPARARVNDITRQRQTIRPAAGLVNQS